MEWQAGSGGLTPHAATPYSVSVTGKERLDLYSTHWAVVMYGLMCLACSLGLVVWIVVSRNERELWVLLAEGGLTLLVAAEATLRLQLVGVRNCTQFPSVWLDVSLCYFCFVLYISVVVIPYLLISENEHEQLESSLAAILLVLRFSIQIVRGAVMCRRQLKMPKTGRGAYVAIDRETPNPLRQPFGNLLSSKSYGSGRGDRGWSLSSFAYWTTGQRTDDGTSGSARPQSSAMRSTPQEAGSDAGSPES